VFDIAAGALLLFWVVRAVHKPRDPARVEHMVDQMSRVASSPAIAIVGAGAVLANPGGFIPIALKDISQMNPSAAQYVAQWVGFAIVSLLPLLIAIVLLAVAPDWTQRVLQRAREWILRNARTIAAVIIALLAAALLRNGIAGLV
jgi:threonine/homoserine/homoserine lactone efflux protein